MQMNKSKYVRIVIYFLMYLISIIFLVAMRHDYYNNAYGNPLYLEVDKMTQEFQFRQIFASVILFMIGYCLVASMIPFLSELPKMILAMPLGIVVWGLSSVTLLVLRIPYIRITAFAGFMIFVVLLLFFHRSNIRKIKGKCLLRALFVVIILANVFSTGYPRYTVTSDTHYCVYIYGRLIASAGKLGVDTVGNLIETTGIMPALMSCFAVFCGFETIQVMHYILMTSLVAGIAVCLHKVFCNIFSQKWKSIGLTIFLMLTAAAPLFLLYDLIISHSWIMVYMFFVATTAEEYSRIESRDTRDGVIWLLALFLSWMSLCRVEAIITVVFMVVCMSYLGLSRREISTCVLPAIILTVVFHAESQIMIAMYNTELPYGSVFITKSILLMMAAVVLLMLAYIILYEKTWVKNLRKYLPPLLIMSLLLVSAAFCAKDIERTGNNFQAIFYNLTSINERWYYFPFFAVIMLVLVIRNKQKYGYWDMLVWGLSLVFFCMSMGRIHPLRYGWGDSFNRYLLHMVPLLLIYLAKGLVMIEPEFRAGKRRMKKECTD